MIEALFYLSGLDDREDESDHDPFGAKSDENLPL